MLIALAALAAGMAFPIDAAEAATYEGLLRAAASADPGVERLTVEEERARIALDRAVLAAAAPALGAGTGTLSASFAGSGATLAGSPWASYSVPGGASLALELPFSSTGSASFAKPGLSAAIPIARGPDAARVALERERVAYARARRARARAELELEARLVAALKAALDSRAAASRAAREEAKARLDLERAVSVDGAVPGGTSYMSLDRARRAAGRASRDALAAEAEALSDLRALAGGADPAGPADLAGPEGGTLVPESYPEPDMSAPLPSPADCDAAVQAREEAGLARLEAAEAGRRTALSAELRAAYGLGELVSATDALGLGLGAGLRASFGRSGLELEAGAGWSPGAGPSATLSLSWKGAPRGEERLRSRDAELAARLREMSVADAERGSREATAALESRRRALVQAARDAEEDLAAAEAQLEAYDSWRSRGLVGDSEYAQALAERDECRARAGSAVLDRMAWSIEARLLTAPAPGGGR